MQKYLILTILAIAGTIIAPAATKQEMEQARALVAKWGVRSQNSGSGYLDGTNPKNLDQVRASVRSHKTDNANLGKLSLSMPSEEEYQSWDNAKMTSYWMSQYNSAVPAGGDKEFCRSKLKSQLASVPATVKVVPKAEETTEETTEETEETTEETEEPTDSVENTADEGLATDIVDAAAANPEVEPLAAPGTNGEREAAKGTQELSSNGSNVWVIVMLVVLVLIVLALVGYASNITARNNKRNQGNPRRNRDRQRSEKENDNADDADEDDDDDDSITAPRADQYNPASRPTEAESAAAMAAAARRNATHRAAPRISQPRIIYLSNANSEGVFLRADAQYNMGNSIFKLITSDGYSGTFSVIDDPNVYEMALMMPVDFLINACSGRNLQLTDGARSIVTDSTGTAIFEDGRWRVARKARIHYTR